MSHFPEPYSHKKNKIDVELDFSNYATKSELKHATAVDKLSFVKKTDLASLKSGVDE